ncbi:MAG: hypothetical protein ACOZAJ_03315 [Patescibacteria group bacterium]
MEKEPNLGNKPEEVLTHIKELAAQYPLEIKNCQTRGDTWLNCYGNCLAASSFYIQSKESYLSPEDYGKYMSKIKNLFDKISDLQGDYSDKQANLPEDLKQSLLEELDITKD